MVRTTLRRLGMTLLGAVFAVPFVTATPAAATDVTVPGCFGVEPTIYCDVTITVSSPYAVDTTSDSVEVCVSVCTQVPVVLAELEPTGTGEVCVSYRNKNTGTVSRTCRPLDGTGGIDVMETLEPWVDFVTGLAGRYGVRVCTRGSTGAYVYDRQTGDTVVDGCFVLAEPTICRAIDWGFEVEAVEVCGL